MNELVTKISDGSIENHYVTLEDVQAREVRTYLVGEFSEGLKKIAQGGLERPEGSSWRITCDEGAYLGGADEAPPPLAYLNASIAFCFLTHIEKMSRMLKIDFQQVSIEQVLRWRLEGSASAGTMRAKCLELRADIFVDSEESDERVAHLTQMAEQTCYASQALREPVPLNTTTVLNGVPLATNEERSNA